MVDGIFKFYDQPPIFIRIFEGQKFGTQIFKLNGNKYVDFTTTIQDLWETGNYLKPL